MKKQKSNKKKDTSKEKNIYSIYFRKFWNYLWNSNSIGSYVLNLLLAFLIIKFLIFPGFNLLLGTNFPIVAVVSGSMQHKIVSNEVCGNYIADISNQNLNFSSWWNECSFFYESNFNITKQKFETFPFINGFNIGDVMIIKGEKPQNVQVGDVIVFIPENLPWYETHGPVIHRVVKKWEVNGTWYFQTKGDHNPESIPNFETKIKGSNVLGVAVFRIPYIGFPKIFLNNVITLIKGI